MASVEIPYKVFQQKHPEYDDAYWRRCKALYSGGQKLLADRTTLREVLPAHLNEHEVVYAERCSRAFYLNYPGSIIDMITAGLFAEQPMMECEPKADDWYSDWFQDVTPPGGKTLTFNDLLKRQITTALCCKRAWTLVELPKPGIEPENALEEERSGALDVYASPVDPECVRDWEFDDDGKLKWALLAFQRNTRDGLTGTRDWIEEEYVYYTAEEFQRYKIKYKKTNPPNDSTPVPLDSFGPHTFGRVPLVTLELTEGMYAMGKLESIAVAHLNTRNALSWAMFKSLFPTPTAFLGPEVLAQPISEDQGRAVKQPRSPAHVVTLAQGDDFRYIGPPTEPFQYAASDCATLRDEMYRVVHHMAQSVDNSGAALQRSGDSKQADMQSTNIVLKFLGEIVHAFAVELLETVGKGRRDVTPDGECKYKWTMKGMEEFNQEIDKGAMLQEAQALALLDINSPTAQVAIKFKAFKSVAGDDMSEEDLKKVHSELETNNPAEQFEYKDPVEMQQQMVAAAGPPDDDDDDDSGNKKEPPSKPPVAKKAKKAS